MNLVHMKQNCKSPFLLLNYVQRLEALSSLFAGVFLFSVCTIAYAIGDSAGCGRPTRLMEAAAFGSPADVERLVKDYLDRTWASLEAETRHLLQASDQAISSWKTDTTNELINAPLPCSRGEWLLDHAVNNGNLPVVTWLLDHGADPNGRTKRLTYGQSIFDRCGEYSRAATRPDGQEWTANENQVKEAYRLLIRRGADINRAEQGMKRLGPNHDYPFNALMNCHYDDMVKMFLDLGADRSPSTGPHPGRLIPLQKALLDAIEEGKIGRMAILSRDGYSDLRGTWAETQLYEFCANPRNFDRCTAIGPSISSTVRLSPGILPNIAHKTRVGQIVLDEFGLTREVCSWPELLFHPEYDFVAIGAKGGNRLGVQYNDEGGELFQVDVTLEKLSKPTLLYLEAPHSTIWNIQRSPGSNLIGLIVAKYGTSNGKDAVIGLDQSIPAYLGGKCARSAFFSQVPDKFSQSIWPGKFSLDSFVIAKNTKEHVTDKSHLIIGDSTSFESSTVNLSKQAIASLGPVFSFSRQNTRRPALAGRAFLEEMVINGKLMRSTARTFTNWMSDALKRGWLVRKIPKEAPPFWDGYVLPSEGNWSQFVFPSGLNGQNSPIFFVFEDTELRGDQGDSTVFFFRSIHGSQMTPKAGKCSGPKC